VGVFAVHNFFFGLVFWVGFCFLVCFFGLFWLCLLPQLDAKLAFLTYTPLYIESNTEFDPKQTPLSFAYPLPLYPFFLLEGALTYPL